MKPSTLALPGMIASCACLALILGAGCGKSTEAGGGGPGVGGGATGGSSGSGGSTAGSGGVMGSGGSSAAGSGGSGSGTGGSATGSGGKASGGSGAGGAASGGSGVGSGGRGSGGATGVGGASVPADAAITDVGPRDGTGRAEMGLPRDTLAETPVSQPDASIQSDADGGCVPDYACKPVSPNTGDPYADCVARVNQFRACVCLPPLARWTAGEACADQDAKYDSEQDVAHAGFSAGICSAGNAQDECPGWGGTPEKVVDGCLLMMFQEGPPPAGSCTGQCYSDHGHYINMTGTSYKNGVACGFYTMASGSIWATQNFK